MSAQSKIFAFTTQPHISKELTRLLNEYEDFDTATPFICATILLDEKGSGLTNFQTEVLLDCLRNTWSNREWIIKYTMIDGETNKIQA